MALATGYPLRVLVEEEWAARLTQFCEVMADRLAARLACTSAEDILGFFADEGLSKIDSLVKTRFEEVPAL